MNYQVTARKWRPKLFADVVGQEHITSTLKNAIKENRAVYTPLFKRVTNENIRETLSKVSPQLTVTRRPIVGRVAA